MATLNYTTNVPVKKTVGEVQYLLADAGADAVAIRYAEKKPVGVSFVLDTPAGQRTFDLPVNVAGVLKVLAEQVSRGSIKGHQPRGGWATGDRAEMVAWRVLKDWLEAQLAIIEANMATLDQIMLPYLRVDHGVTLYNRYVAEQQMRELEPES